MPVLLARRADAEADRGDLQGKVRIAFKHLPCPSTTRRSWRPRRRWRRNEQGKFWEYHDKLFANQQALDRPSLEKYAGELGLNMAKFKAALDSRQVQAAGRRRGQAGDASAPRGTPTFFVNGRSLVGAQPFEKFKELIDQELK